MNDWLTDSNGNRCSIIYWGSSEAAQTALDSLKECRDCINCSRCWGCSGCSRCWGCSGCSDCSDCSDCSGCSGCSRCWGCSDCSDCSDCSNVASLTDKKNLKGDPNSKAPAGAPPIPTIENIHAAIFDAVSRPKALDMSAWHTCKTTHCRAGWVVHLAGKAGYALERFHNTALAAQLIYRESGYPINPGRFYDNNADALADMKRLAGGGA